MAMFLKRLMVPAERLLVVSLASTLAYRPLSGAPGPSTKPLIPFRPYCLIRLAAWRVVY